HQLALPGRPEQPGGWVTVRRRQSSKKSTKVHHQALHVSNKFSPSATHPLTNQLWLLAAPQSDMTRSLAWWGHDDLCLCCGEKVEWPRAPYEDI
ncbi:hypothetical protein L3Q82_015344, partial [Scortum barcoo]